MKRLVYSPKINAYIKADSGIYDISEYIVDFNIDRKINQVSTAELTIRNPNKKWTNNPYTDTITGERKIGPVFHPMDPITIFLTRLQNRPVQVFTGYCDQTPYLQLFPGTVPIKASCTLKKLQYTFFDAGLPFMREFLEQSGWFPNEDGSIVKPQAEEQNNQKSAATETNEGVRFGDSGIGELLFKVLNEIGGWPEETIYIQNMPPSVINLVSNLFELFKKEDEESSKELTELLKKIVGTAAKGTGDPPGEGTSPSDEKGGAGFELGNPIVVGHPELKAGISEVVNAITKRWPEIQITSTTGGEHAAGSLHYLGRAADLAYPMTTAGIKQMNEASAWINSSGLWKHLTEGIHNPKGAMKEALLSVKYQKKVPYTYWGEPTWAEHYNHIHVGV